jgi:hypothetical protein
MQRRRQGRTRNVRSECQLFRAQVCLLCVVVVDVVEHLNLLCLVRFAATLRLAAFLAGILLLLLLFLFRLRLFLFLVAVLLRLTVSK